VFVGRGFRYDIMSAKDGAALAAEVQFLRGS
jgi:hypothetical protein